MEKLGIKMKLALLIIGLLPFIMVESITIRIPPVVHYFRVKKCRRIVAKEFKKNKRKWNRLKTEDIIASNGWVLGN